MWRALPAIRASDRGASGRVGGAASKAKAVISASAPTYPEFDEVYRDAAAARDYGDAVQDGLKALIDLDRPTRSRCCKAMQSAAVSGSRSLAILRFCAADAYLAVTPAKLGLVYGHAETRRLVELVGPSRAKDLLFTGRRIETEEALADRAHRPSDRDRAARRGARLRAWPGGAQPGVDSGRQARSRRDRRRHDGRDAGLSRARRNPPRSASTLPRGARPSPRNGRRSSPFAARPRRFRWADEHSAAVPAMISLVLDGVCGRMSPWRARSWLALRLPSLLLSRAFKSAFGS